MSEQYLQSLEWSDVVDNSAVEVSRVSETSQDQSGKQLLPAVRYVEDADSDGEQIERELLTVSPYTSKSHLLDLNSVEPSAQYLARALTVMRAVRSDYATAPYERAFNWSAVVSHLKGLLEAERFSEWEDQRFYIIVFRSQLPVGTDRTHLGLLDERAHEEATKGGGLLKYWFGTPDNHGRNLATCVWRRRSDARIGGAGPGHARAMAEAKALYTYYTVQRLSLNISKDAQSWSITDWKN